MRSAQCGCRVSTNTRPEQGVLERSNSKRVSTKVVRADACFINDTRTSYFDDLKVSKHEIGLGSHQQVKWALRRGRTEARHSNNTCCWIARPEFQLRSLHSFTVVLGGQWPAKRSFTGATCETSQCGTWHSAPALSPNAALPLLSAVRQTALINFNSRSLNSQNGENMSWKR